MTRDVGSKIFRLELVSAVVALEVEVMALDVLGVKCHILNKKKKTCFYSWLTSLKPFPKIILYRIGP